eukprot:TRINITY_DN18999_c0_g1_i1.p1 TRINITY_DN18999_c0_g1~~TRINITY_DN18999_c0_g1_i1.p1  ORF type:complete len:118 (-),score=14.15 TRINITY_DN18999_c0_g1_i1:316-669(-)
MLHLQIVIQIRSRRSDVFIRMQNDAVRCGGGTWKEDFSGLPHVLNGRLFILQCRVILAEIFSPAIPEGLGGGSRVNSHQARGGGERGVRCCEARMAVKPETLPRSIKGVSFFLGTGT